MNTLRRILTTWEELLQLSPKGVRVAGANVVVFVDCFHNGVVGFLLTSAFPSVNDANDNSNEIFLDRDFL